MGTTDAEEIELAPEVLCLRPTLAVWGSFKWLISTWRRETVIGCVGLFILAKHQANRRVTIYPPGRLLG